MAKFTSRFTSTFKAFAGKDATSAFKNRGHSENAQKLMKKYIIGKV